MELSLTPAGRRLDKRVAAARETLFDLAREALGERDLTAALELLRELVELTSFGELVARRRELYEHGQSAGRA